MKTKKTLTALSAFIILISALITGCGSAGDHSSKSGLYFDTVVSVEIFGSDAEELAGECMNMCRHYESLFDKNTASSDIAKINAGSGKEISVDPETVRLITEALRYSEMSDGCFDITIGPVSSLWDFHEEASSLPSEESLSRACAKVGYRNISVSAKDCTVTIPDGYALDVGGAAKGFIADRIAEYLGTRSITGAIINMGGDLKLVGTKSDGRMFNIGVNDPADDGNMICSLYLSDTSVATSGTYERCFTLDGKKYHHILDPSTGYPVDTDIESVTVITGNALSSDCLCTVCIMLGSKEAMALIESLDDTEAVILKTDGTVIRSSGAGAYIRQ